MSTDAGMTTARLLAAFTDEITAVGGEVTDPFDDGRRLFARSVLPQVKEVRPGDGMKGGVAIRANEKEVWLHPYFFRLVCKNGAITARALQTRHFEDLDTRDVEETERCVRETVAACCDEDVFDTNTSRMRTAAETEADLSLTLMSMLGRFSGHRQGRMMTDIMQHLFQDGDRTMFGVANAITATARDTEDPQVRWELEELGGGVAVGEVPSPPRFRPSAKASLQREGAVC